MAWWQVLGQTKGSAASLGIVMTMFLCSANDLIVRVSQITILAP